jgi:hypothetical protein
MKWLSTIAKYLPESPQTRQAREEEMKVAIQKHLDNGRDSYHSSWMSSEFGLPDFRMALDIQNKLYGDADHPAKIQTLVWIAKALHKQNDNLKSMEALKTAFRMQLQHSGLYQSAMVVILDTVVTVASSSGTPLALSQAKTYSKTLQRIKYRLYGKSDSFSDVVASTPWLKDTGGAEKSLLVEKEGDHVLIDDHYQATSKFRDAALLEYQEWGSRSLSLALLHRKGAIASLDRKVAVTLNDPFELIVTPNCRSDACKAIRMADSLLLENYEQATGQYMHAKKMIDESHPYDITQLHFACIAILLLFLWNRAVIVHRLIVGISEMIGHLNKKITCPPGKKDNDRRAKDPIVHLLSMIHSFTKQEENSVQNEGIHMDTVGPKEVQQANPEDLADSDVTISEPQDQQQIDDDNVFARSFESLGTSFMDREIERVKAGHLDSTILDSNSE